MRGEFTVRRAILRPSLLRVALALGAAMLAVTTCGCWAAALELAPLGLQALKTAINGTADVAAGATMEAHQKDAMDFDDDDSTDAKTSARHQQDVCNELQIVVPGIIQLRSDTAGAIEWRELALGGSPDSPQWTISPPDKGGVSSATGWQPAVNLGKLDFEPAIQGVVPPGAPTYLAYAPAQAQTSFERDELISLQLDFGPNAGTFKWDGRIYDYTLVKSLPCFPAPPV
jgi:hypothetical protein